jgi:hypothetical protein
VQSAMLLLRQCMAPTLNYLLRCTPPSCIADTCAEFDAQVISAAVDKLDITDEEAAAPDTARLLRARLKDGGFGLTSAALTSPGAYLGSLAAAHTAVAFAPYSAQSRPLPADSLLHGWIGQSSASAKHGHRAALSTFPQRQPRSSRSTSPNPRSSHLPSNALSTQRQLNIALTPR